MTTPAENKAIVLEAFDTLLNKRDYEMAATFWSHKYIQHSAHILYEALNEPAKKDAAALLAAAAHPDYQSYHSNDEFLTRDQLAECHHLSCER